MSHNENKIDDKICQESPISKKEITKTIVILLAFGCSAIGLFMTGMIILMVNASVVGAVLLILGMLLLPVTVYYLLFVGAYKIRMYRQYTQIPDTVNVIAEGTEFKIQHRKFLLWFMGIMSVIVFLLLTVLVTGVFVQLLTDAAQESSEGLLACLLVTPFVLSLLAVCVYFFFYAKNHRIVFTKDGIVFRGFGKEKFFAQEEINPEPIRFVVRMHGGHGVPTQEVKTVFLNRANKKLFVTSINTAVFNRHLALHFAAREVNHADVKKYCS